MKGAKLIIVMFLLLAGTCVGETIIQPNSYLKCYKACLKNLCSGKSAVGCYPTASLLCAGKCLLKKSSPSNVNRQPHHNYCILGCASYNCVNINTPENIYGEEVEGCLDSCSNKCDRKY
ncbi:hypothetical protein MKW94_018811 [Papaver nudicaule]|uniref:Thionin-like protein n=1 Tax=Papaver nudicaule TaxID=74823 RepID=A0AA41VKC8_PAPNU|nr:hypothetical protein [Papaver nudicaule]